MVRIEGLKLAPGQDEQLLRGKAARLLRVKEFVSLRVLRRSVDARDGVQLVYTVEAIVESINRYNELVAAGNGDEDFGKRDEYMVPIEAPCYAVPRGANNIDALVDGLWCDGNFQCLDVDMKPIEGLFAVGNASGPFFGNSNYPMDIEGLSVGRAITTGFATGRYVAGL